MSGSRSTPLDRKYVTKGGRLGAGPAPLPSLMLATNHATRIAFHADLGNQPGLADLARGRHLFRQLGSGMGKIRGFLQKPMTDDGAKQPYQMPPVSQQRGHLLDIVPQVSLLVIEKPLAFSGIHPVCAERR